MNRAEKYCQMCGAVPGDPCLYISQLTPEHEMVQCGFDVAHEIGDVRPDFHWARHGDQPYSVIIPNEPEYA